LSHVVCADICFVTVDNIADIVGVVDDDYYYDVVVAT